MAAAAAVLTYLNPETVGGADQPPEDKFSWDEVVLIAVLVAIAAGLGWAGYLGRI